MADLNEFDLLLVMAQIAVAFAGFASIASALSQRDRPDETRVDAGRLINMLVVSLCTAMLALVPFIPALFGATEALVWRSSAVIAATSAMTFAPRVIMRTMRMKRYAGFSWRTNALNLGLAGVAACAFVLCALGFPASRPSASYFIGIVALILTCVIVFYRIIVSLLRPHAPD